MVKKMNKKRLAELNERARKYNVKEGIFSSAKDALGVQYISPLPLPLILAIR